MKKSKFLATLAAVGLATFTFVGTAAPAAATEGEVSDPAVVTESTEEVVPLVVESSEAELVVAPTQPETYSFCHATEVVGAKNGWLALGPLPVVAISAGHGNHSGDIIPVIVPEYPTGQNLATVYTNYDPDLTGAEILAGGCADSPDPIDVCDNLEGDQAEVPEGYYESEGDCFELETLGPVQPSVSFKQITCDADGSYTLGASVPGDSDKLDWTVNGTPNVPSGTYYVTSALQVTVAASAIPPDTLEFDWVDPDPFNFVEPVDCDLDTLALTGSSAPPLWALNAGIGVLVLGAGMLLLRRRTESLFE